MRSLTKLAFFSALMLGGWAQAVCNTPAGVAGQLEYISNDMKFCNNSVWASTAVAVLTTTCSDPGKIEYASGDLRFCNGSFWVTMNGPVINNSCVGTTAGTYRYNSPQARMEWCDGTNWKLMALGGLVAVDLNGSAQTADGLPFVTPATAGLTIGGGAVPYSGPQIFSPAVDTNTNNMLASVTFKITSTVGDSWTMSKVVTNGSYNLYFYCVENNVAFFRSTTIRVEGTDVATGVCNLAMNAWQKLGPYTVTVSDGTLNIDIVLASNEDPLMSGVVISPVIAP